MSCEPSIMFFLAELIYFPACSVVTCPDGCDALKVILIIVDTSVAEMD